MGQVRGIHHVSAIASDPQRNLDFYGGVLGLRLVKRTVNFDDPQTYHLYYGDEAGTPGGIMTFFPWPRARPGRQGTGQVAVTSFAILPGAVGFWIERLLRHGVHYQGPAKRTLSDGSTEQVISFRDHDGLMLELVASEEAESRGAWSGAPGIPREHAIHGFHHVTLWVERHEASERALVDTLGFRAVTEENGTRRYAAGDGGPGALVDVREVGGFPLGTDGAGTVHHVAWNIGDDATELALRERIVASGMRPTPVIDRMYFRSVYFREPGGVLYELATADPGFLLDEPVEQLGERLMLPPQYEARRSEIEAALPVIHVAGAAAGSSAFADAEGAEKENRAALDFVHRYLPSSKDSDGAGSTTLLLLHGTGGDENDLIPLGRALLPGAAMLSPRGKVSERGAARFFRRLAEGVFDQQDLERRTGELVDFVKAAEREYDIGAQGLIAVGFSNGANIATSVLLRHPGVLHGAVLLSPMVPFEPDPLPDLRGTPIFIGAGRKDPLVAEDEVERLADILRAAGADVTVHWQPGGHTITGEELEAARDWIERLAFRGSTA